MAKSQPAPRKQRTRQHVIADLSANYVERLILEEGHTAQRLRNDYGYDLFVQTFDGDGYVEPGFVLIQLKATDDLRIDGTECLCDLEVRDCNLWLAEKMPVILVLYDAQRRKARWLWVQDYFRRPDRLPTPGAKTVRVRIPLGQLLTRKAVTRMRRLAREAHARETGATP